MAFTHSLHTKHFGKVSQWIPFSYYVSHSTEERLYCITGSSVHVHVHTPRGEWVHVKMYTQSTLHVHLYMYILCIDLCITMPLFYFRYDGLFRFLLLCRRAQIALQQVWALLMQYRRKAEQLRPVWELRTHMGFLVDNLQYYVQVKKCLCTLN